MFYKESVSVLVLKNRVGVYLRVKNVVKKVLR